MEHKKSFYTFALIILNFITLSCGDENLSTQYPPSPVNIPNAIIFNPELKYDTVSDIDGNIYKTIAIGKHTWMAENLRVTRFLNGDKIPHIPSKKDWARDFNNIYSTSVLGLCVYDNNNNKDSIARYGLLYSLSVMDDERGIAPVGWHIANSSEWFELNYSFGVYSPDIENTGFTPLCAGNRDPDGSYSGRGESEMWVASGLDYRFMYFKKGSGYNTNILTNMLASGMLWRIGNGMFYGYPIRCVKD